MLCHNPDAKEILRPFDWDVMLCGHTHGGQLRIPFTNYAPLAPVKDLTMTEGLHALDGRSIYITRESEACTVYASTVGRRQVCSN